MTDDAQVIVSHDEFARSDSNYNIAFASLGL